MHRSSRLEVFCKKGVLRNFTKFTGKHLCQSLFFNKVVGLRPATLLKKRLWPRCFPVNFVKFPKTLFLHNTSGGCFWMHSAQERQFFIKDFLSKYKNIRKKLQIWSYLLKKSLIETMAKSKSIVHWQKWKLSLLIFPKIARYNYSIYTITHYSISCIILKMCQTILGHYILNGLRFPSSVFSLNKKR